MNTIVLLYILELQFILTITLGMDDFFQRTVESRGSGVARNQSTMVFTPSCRNNNLNDGDRKWLNGKQEVPETIEILRIGPQLHFYV